MRKLGFGLWQIVLALFFNCILLWALTPISGVVKALLICVLCTLYITYNIVSGGRSREDKKLNGIANGAYLLEGAIVQSVIQTAVIVLVAIFTDCSVVRQIINGVFGYFFIGVTAFNGIIRTAVNSRQVKIKWYIILLFTWYLPVINVFIISHICKISKRELRFEQAKQDLDNVRRESEICKTKYPILMVHGIFFRDWQLLNYWGRIPKELIRNGATIYYGKQQSANRVDVSAGELRDQILRVINETGAEKLNIIAHSKGGLDSRYAISRLGMDKYVASLTTINTPHYGCKFVDGILAKVSDGFFNFVDRRYNKLFTVLGDTAPSFRNGVEELTYASCQRFNEQTPNAEGVYYHAVMSKMNSVKAAGFPLNLGYMLNKKHGSGNDGLVTVESGLWGESPMMINHNGKRGISHGDMIDLFRENIDGFDVREFYVDLVKDLKNKGF